MPGISVRFSEHEARKPYARPLMVAFEADDGSSLGAIAVSGADLLYYRQFQVAVLSLAGELYSDAEIEADADPQRAWLDRVGRLLPSVHRLRLRPVSSFDHQQGRLFHLEAEVEGRASAAGIDPAAAFEYQEVQAAIAHQTGCLYREPEIEAIQDPDRRRSAWMRSLAAVLERPAPEEAMAASWPWRAPSRG